MSAFDASPWGLGGWLSVNGKVVNHFSDAIASHDETIFGCKIGSSDGQQIWECLAVLVALRLWAPLFREQRMSLQVRGDNVGALMLLIKMRPPSSQLAIIARELALCIATASFPPNVVHTPGIAHKLADLLSRVHKMGVEDTISHPALSHSQRDWPEPRLASWYKTLTAFGTAA